MMKFKFKQSSLIELKLSIPGSIALLALFFFLFGANLSYTTFMCNLNGLLFQSDPNFQCHNSNDIMRDLRHAC